LLQVALLLAALAGTAAAAQTLRPGQAFRDCPECPELVVVPAGSFVMGSPAGEADRSPFEGPQRAVTFARPFAVGRTEVTFAEWDACRAAGGCGGHRPDDMGWGRDRRPVMNVSFDDAKRYLEWLRLRTGKSYRLLTEAEWEYAARAGAATPFNVGTFLATDQANYDGASVTGGRPKGEFRRQALPVASFPPNRFGLHDVHGNVAEWVEDCWKPSYEGTPGDGSAWQGRAACEKRVVRGGSWLHPIWRVRSAARLSQPPDYRNFEVGFRVARTLD
jgi:formylglycine-generating enzyme required for sulfatase activity